MNETQAKPRRRWFQVSLREWFLVVALIVVGIAWWREHLETARLSKEIQHRKRQEAQFTKELVNTLDQLHEAKARVNELTAPERKALSDAAVKDAIEEAKRIRAERIDGSENDAIILEVR